MSIKLIKALFPDEERVTLYTTYGYLSDDIWIVPMRAWVHEPRVPVEHVITRAARNLAGADPVEIRNFQARICAFVADSESRETVVLAFDGDQKQQEFRIENQRGRFPKTDRNGCVEGIIRLSRNQADDLLAVQNSTNGWLTCRAVSRDHTGSGRIRLIPPEGHSVISDIDDTIKVTEIFSGRRRVIQNTFFRDFKIVPEMVELYRSWHDAVFHYVSGSPWQLFGPLSEFLFSDKAGFPEGSFHMKNVRKNLMSLSTWKDLRNLVVDENRIIKQKVNQITEIIQRFPLRSFTLVGDSGEKDPEVYREIRQRFPNQIQQIVIRDGIKNTISVTPEK